MCDNSREHRREGANDFRRGYFDYERHSNRHFDDCDKSYHDGYEREKLNQNEQREVQQQEEAHEMRRQRNSDYEAKVEEDYYNMIYEENLRNREMERELQNYYQRQQADELPF